MAAKDLSQPAPGLAVDSKGNPVIDPTANVLKLVDEAVRRINDLNAMQIEFNEKIRHGDTKRQDDVRNIEVDKINQMFSSHKEYFDSKLEAQKNLSAAVLNERDAKLTDKFSSLATAIDKAFEAQKTLSDAVLTERDAKLTDKFASLATAINKAEVATEKRFESVNEFRSTLTDQQKTFISSSEYKSAHQNLQELVGSSVKTLSDTILTQKERIDKLENLKTGGRDTWIIIVGVIGFATGLISFILNLLGK